MKLTSVLVSTLAVGVQAQANCPGYTARNIKESNAGVTADLHLAGKACNVYGTDLPNLTLTVEYQTRTNRLLQQLTISLTDGRGSPTRDRSRSE